ncbi:acyl-CoA dehydratase activase [Papillibacter cinnamivorans]|uniref:Benzoyl-CoA reductase subunit A n=1 Tax=Papillibacter cinnamivorans DSM 12816 TaxID=1122930 RepID=A0A1W2CBI0_9FIRM|nr:acyl-CoA dehydratase activase [Papillibacter cinnamivorans]SMC82635.1 benzoyl-CoA reductase subunit A [Papillibacter cinnamivorans DSM 12816]
MLVAGIDIGSLSAKAVLMDGEELLGGKVIYTGPDPVESAEQVLRQVLAPQHLRREDIRYIVATGYGRVNVPFAQSTVTEISCHARGNHYHFPGVRTILDMGGQDCKAIRSDENGRLTNFVMNDKCAAGTGRHLERVASTLGLKLDEIGDLSLSYTGEPCLISSTCAVFAQTSIVGFLRAGYPINNILAGAIDAVVDRVLALMDAVGVEEELCISGGVAKNSGVVRRVEERLGMKARIAPEPQIVGAIGAALFARDRARR